MFVIKFLDYFIVSTEYNLPPLVTMETAKDTTQYPNTSFIGLQTKGPRLLSFLPKHHI